MIRYLKEHLAIAERANGDGKWATHLPGILKAYNNSLIKGTNVRRGDVDQNNYLTLLGKLRRTTEPTMIFNMTESFRYPSALAGYIWRYKVGDKVTLARRVDFQLKDRHYFEKASVKGTYGPSIYTITACKTKLNGDYFLCGVYSLDKIPNVLFYESELSPALFATTAAAASSKKAAGAAPEIVGALPRRRRRRRRSSQQQQQS